ncbi:MAG: SGNH/GDSL hydrolase family protein [Planctomycetes bacterium]|nr:SGNH/GDSL hydrolase family protein [Planctomycetota bacterium]
MTKPLRALVLPLVLLAACAFPAAAAEQGLAAGDLVAICGDSITEQKDYSVDIEDYLLMCQPVAKLQAMQFGWGGETSWGFLGRMANDALPFAPQVATTCYGMNDGGYAPLGADRAKQYHDAQKGIVAAFKKAGTRFIVVGAPGCVDADTFHHSPEQAVMYNKTLAELGALAKQVADEEGVVFADVHGAMMTAMAKAKEKYGKEYVFAGGDGVHPGRNGHLVMAYAYLKALGCDGAIGTVTVDLAAKKAETTAGHRILAVGADGAVQVVSTRYPFCVSGDPKQQTTASAAEFIPFNQELNRFLLVVTNPGAERLAVTWGAATKEFSAADLAKGINLAAEFGDNPFTPFFLKVESAVRGQQIYETEFVKNFLHNVPQYRQVISDEGATWDRLVAKGTAKAVGLRATASEALVPVTHVITIKAVK